MSRHAARPHEPFDVIVIGAGIVGSAIARQLSRYHLRVAIVDARPDIGDGTSKANTAILHTGFDAQPGTLESQLVRRGYELLSGYAETTGIPVERVGAVLVAWDEEQHRALDPLKRKAEANGYTHARLVDADEVYRLAPNLGGGARAGLVIPDESITCTWTTNLALATDARQRGATVLLDRPVDGVELGRDVTLVRSGGEAITTRWVVNAAGLGGDKLDQLFGHDRFALTPRRGQLLVFDKQARPLIDRIVLPVPTKLGKGVLVSPTVYGNVMVGPTAEDLADREDTGTTEEGLRFLLEKAGTLMPALLDEEVTATYAGLRAASDHSDYVIELDSEQRYVVVGGIRSTGLTAGMAIAEYVEDLIANDGQLDLAERDDLPEPSRMPNLGEAFRRPYQDAARIGADPEYGKVVCFCERVTAGEIRDACASALPPNTLEGLRRRTRAMNGRCQGFYCGAEILSRFESANRHLQQPSRNEAKGGARS
jgi:glycerol-3-phosphate dehydrogenase